MQFLADYPERTYFLAFVLLSGLILIPWPRAIAGWQRIIMPLSLVVTWLVIARFLNIDLESSVDAVAGYLQSFDIALVDDTFTFIRAKAESSALWLNLSVTLLFMGAYVLVRLVFVVFFRGFAFLFGMIIWLLEKLHVLKPGYASSALQVAASAAFLRQGLLIALGLIGLVYASIGFFHDNASINGYFSALFWAGAWIALLEIRSLLVIDERLGNGGRFPGSIAITGSDSEVTRFRRLGDIYRKLRADYGEQLLLSGAPQSPPTSQTGHTSNTRAAQTIDNNVKGALEDYAAGNDLAFTEALCSTHIQLIGQILLSTRDFGQEVLILAPASVGKKIEPVLFQRFSAQYIRDSCTIHHWKTDGTPTGYVDFHFCAFDCFDYFLEQKKDFRNIGLVVALEMHQANLGELRFAYQRLWHRLDATRVRKIFQSGDYYNAEPAIRFLSKTQNLKEHYLTTRVAGNKFLLVWDRPDIDDSLNQQVTVKFTGAVDAAILVAKATFDLSQLSTTWLDEAHRFDKDMYEDLRARNDMSWLAHCDNRTDIDQHAFLVATEDLSNLSFARQDTANFQQEHVYLHHIFSSNYLLRDAMADMPEIEGRLWSPIMPNVEGDLDNLAHQCAQELAKQRLTQKILEDLLDLFVQQNLLRDLRITASLPGLQRLFRSCYGLEDVNINHSALADGTTSFGFAGVHPESHLISVRDSSGVAIGSCSRKDHGLLYARQTDLFLDGSNYRITGIDDQAVIVSHTEAADDRRRKYVFARDYALEYFAPVSDPVDFTLANTRVVLTRSRVHFTRYTTGFLSAPESMHLMGNMRYHRLNDDTAVTIARRYKNSLRLKISRDDLPLDNIEGMGFTLAALVTDALYSLFPQQAAHIAVLPTHRQLRTDDKANSGNFPLFIYPQLVNGLASSEQSMDTLEILIVEDADGDLGVVSTLFQERTKIIEVIQFYLDWYKGKQPESGYHHFGAKQVHSCFNYADLNTFLADFSRSFAVGIQHPADSPGELDESSLSTALCDFCGRDLASGFDQLSDGRHRCIECSKNALEKMDDFRTLLQSVIRRMESAYNIRIRQDISVEFATADRIGKASQSPFIPTQGFDSRAVGLAIMRGDKFSMLIESGAPELQSTMTIAHELTHIWQYEYLSDAQLRDIEWVEGQARYIEIDYARLIGEHRGADQLAKQMETGTDLYCRGYRDIVSKIGRTRRGKVFTVFSGS